MREEFECLGCGCNFLLLRKYSSDKIKLINCPICLDSANIFEVKKERELKLVSNDFCYDEEVS